METENRLKMNYQVYVLFNGSLVVLNILANAFYVFCMVCPLHRERIKQPVKLLLWSLICCTIIYLMSVFVMVFSHRTESIVVSEISNMVALCSLSNSVTFSFWLNFFYYTQIVPAQRTLFICIKKNIKSLIYCFWLVDRINSLFDFSVLFFRISYDGFGLSNNFTMDHDVQTPAMDFSKWPLDTVVIVVSSLKAYLIVCLCVMVMTSYSTVVYLCRHMRRMVTNGQSLSCPQFRSQVRVAVISILQGVLYVCCAVWTMYGFFSQNTSRYLIYPTTNFTVINLYMLGTMLNLGAGQAVFRQRAADIWLRAARCCKVQPSEQGG